MNTIGPITLLMLKHHAKINDILLKFEEVSEKDVLGFTNLFEEFKKKVNKHFFIEEMNIFPVSNKNDSKEVLKLKNLLKDHQDLKGIVEEMQGNISNERKPNTTILRELLFAHEQREVEGFYPLLDTRLSEQDKKKIVTEINSERF